ncbi:hypothetical protein HK101_003037 [Irineochytrium annulatum]|nr:hypothetical protein HK101_003037 [Irineochytrium annulatum]
MPGTVQLPPLVSLPPLDMEVTPSVHGTIESRNSTGGVTLHGVTDLEAGHDAGGAAHKDPAYFGKAHHMDSFDVTNVGMPEGGSPAGGAGGRREGWVKRSWNWTLAFCRKYRRWMIAFHYAFIAFNCAVVLPITLLVSHPEAAAKSISTAAIDFTLYLSAISLASWILSTLVAFSPTLDALNLRLFSSVLRLNRRWRFWTWLVYNVCQLSLWLAVTTLFWDVSFLCWHEGEWADLDPFRNTCDELSNIWFYAIFSAGAIALNLVFIVDDEFAESKRELEELHESALDVLRVALRVAREGQQGLQGKEKEVFEVREEGTL